MRKNKTSEAEEFSRAAVFDDCESALKIGANTYDFSVKTHSRREDDFFKI